MRNVLVIRFGALGDLCLLGWALAGLADRSNPESQQVTLVTKAAFAPLVSRFRGVDEVIGLTDTSLRGVQRLATQLRQQPWDAVLDAHNTLRSHLLLGLMTRRPDARLAKDTLARLGFMSWGRHDPRLELRMRDRFEALTAVISQPDGTVSARPPLAHFTNQPAAPVVGLAPGAQWDTKRWPDAHYAELLRLFRADNPTPVRIYLGPREACWYPGSALAVAANETADVEIVSLPDLAAVAHSLADLSLLITNDSGLLHLAEASGTKVLAFFGPTVREFGYFPLLENSRVLERDESCRPCSRNGKRACRREDLACLNGISPALALTTLQSMLAKETM